jgi:hypothetical protein
MPPTPGMSNILPDLSGLFINEIMTSNTNVIADNHGEFDDWIELYNAGTVSIDLGGLFVSDSIGDPKPSRISSEHPDSTTLEPGKFLLLWADDSDEQGVLHTNFKLSRSGEQVVVFGYDSKEIIDSITYNEVPRNFTFGRIADGIQNWGELVQPTPNRSNTITDLNTASFRSSDFKYKTYPNPSSEQTVFQVQIAEDTRLVVKVFSNTGELLAIPVNDFYQAGSYDITWDLSGDSGNRLSNGLYFYTIETEDSSIQDKLIIMHR